MNKGLMPPLRKHLETWERAAAGQWQAVIRSPQVLQRVGEQLTRTLESHQRIKATLSQTSPEEPPAVDPAYIAYLLERVQGQIEALTVRINRIERKMTR